MIGRAVSRAAMITGGLALGALAAAIYREQAKKHTRKSVKEQVATWEGEGGAVPSVPTPTPTVAAESAGWPPAA